MKELNKLNKEEIKKKVFSKEWKEKNKEYIKSLERFLDVTDNISDEKLRLDVIYKMLKCDDILTQIAERYINKYKNQKND